MKKIVILVCLLLFTSFVNVFAEGLDVYSQYLDNIPSIGSHGLLPSENNNPGKHKIYDVNFDGVIDVSDIVSVINIIAKANSSDEGDVNCDGKIDISDIVAIINCISMSYNDSILNENHFAFFGKNLGSCKELVGDTYLVLCFVSTPEHPWTESKKKEVNQVSRSSIGYMKTEAQKYGVELNMKFGGLDFEVPYEFTKDRKWYNYILEHYYHTSTIVDVYNSYKKSLNSVNTPMIFLFNSYDRSFTYSCKKNFPNWNEEFCVIFCDTKMHDNYLTHEVMHLFGAIDLYDYNNEGIKSLALKYFPESDMLRVSHYIDELTAYLIGWKKELTTKSIVFLNQIDGLR